eukprot:jgi/Picsp_1/5539/NSC_02898-R1_hypothetical protein COCSUDRAFT_68037 [Coccomyxa subellipsoidea C-169]
MELLSGYGSDSGETESSSPINKRNQRDGDIVKKSGFLSNSSETVDTRAKGLVMLQSSMDGLAGPPAKSVKASGPRKGNIDSLKIGSGLKSRWAKSSSFLVPVAYDEADAVADESSGKETDNKISRKQTRGDILQGLADVLPPPSHEVRDKAEGSIVAYSEEAKTVPEPSTSGQVGAQRREMATRETLSGKASGYSSNSSNILCGVNAAPDVKTHALPQEYAAAVQYSGQQPGTGDRGIDLLPPGIQFKDVSAANLRYDGPGAAGSDSSALRSALGPEYESMLRAEASKIGHVPKMAKKKHQLSALFLHAKDQEIDQLEKRATGMKSKAETQRKYGW